MWFRVADARTAYVCLALAICCEVVGTTAMKASAGFQAPGYALIMLVSYVLSFSLMTLALEVLDLGVAYATWSGVGTTVTAIIAVIKFNEKMTWIKALAIVCVVLSVTFLQLVSTPGPQQAEDGDRSQKGAIAREELNLLRADEEHRINGSGA